MEDVQLLQLVACFLHLNFAKMAEKMMLMITLVLRDQFLRHQATLFMIEHRGRRRRRECRHNPYFWKLPKPNRSWFEIHYNDQTIPGEFFRRQLWMDRCTFDIQFNVLRPVVTRESTKLRDCIVPLLLVCPLVIGQFAFTFPFGLRWHFWILCSHIYSIIISLMKRRLENYSTVVGCPGWLKIVSFLVVIGCHIPAPDLLIRLVTIFRKWIKTPITGVHLKLKLYNLRVSQPWTITAIFW